MLRQAHRRTRAERWGNVRLMCADATTVDPASVIACAGGRAAAVLATYSLSLMDAWPKAWSRMQAVAAPGARLAVVDMQLPEGTAAQWRWLARIACSLGGSNIHAHPWTGVETDCDDVRSASAHGRHIQVRSGTLALRRFTVGFTE